MAQCPDSRTATDRAQLAKQHVPSIRGRLRTWRLVTVACDDGLRNIGPRSPRTRPTVLGIDEDNRLYAIYHSFRYTEYAADRWKEPTINLPR